MSIVPNIISLSDKWRKVSLQSQSLCSMYTTSFHTALLTSRHFPHTGWQGLFVDFGYMDRWFLCTNSAYYSAKCDDTPIFLDRSVLGTGKIYLITGQANPTLDSRPKKTQKSTIRFSSRSNRWFYARNLIWMNPGGLPVEEHLNHALVRFFILQTINCLFKPQILRMSDGWWSKQRYG